TAAVAADACADTVRLSAISVDQADPAVGETDHSRWIAADARRGDCLAFVLPVLAVIQAPVLIDPRLTAFLAPDHDQQFRWRDAHGGRHDSVAFRLRADPRYEAPVEAAVIRTRHEGSALSAVALRTRGEQEQAAAIQDLVVGPCRD